MYIYICILGVPGEMCQTSGGCSLCYYSHILMKLEFSPQIFERYWNIQISEYPSSGSHAAGGQTHRHRHTDTQTHRHTDITKLILAFRHFAKAPNNAPQLTIIKRHPPKYIPVFTYDKMWSKIIWMLELLYHRQRRYYALKEIRGKIIHTFTWPTV